MRNTLLTTAALFGIALALPALAQTATDPNPANPSAVKDGTPAAGTGSGNAPGTDPVAAGKTGATLGAQAPSTGSSVAGTPAPSSDAPAMGASPTNTPAGGTSSDETAPSTPATPRHHAMRSSATRKSTMAEGSGHWAHQPGTGESGPASSKASNIDSADTRSTIAPHLPAPKGGTNASPEHYLMAAQHALKSHKTGEAQQALEMAETRLLDRSTPAASAAQASTDPRIADVSAARKALASKDWQAATASIQQALNTSGGMSSDTGMAASGGPSSSTGMAAGGGAGTGAMQNGTNEGGNGMASQGTMTPATNPATATPSVNATGTGPDGTKAAGVGQGGGVLGTSTNDSAGGAK